MNTTDIFTDFRPDTRLWIYAFPQKLDGQQLHLVRTILNEFVQEWKSHQDDVRGEYEILYDQFVFMAGESIDKISGCSIDSSVKVFKFLRDQHGLDALDRNRVYHREGEVVEMTLRAEFQPLVDAGKITPDTIVFDNSIHTVGDLHAGKWELPFKQSWHAEAFAG